jgi:hypothetical protein
MEEQKPQYLITIEQNRDLILQEIGAFKVATVDDMAVGSTFVGKLKKFLKYAEDYRKETVAPLVRQKKAIDDHFDQATSKAKAVLYTIDKEVIAFQDLLDRQARAEQARLDAAAAKKFDKQIAKGITPTLPEPIAQQVEKAPTMIRNEVGTMTFKINHKWRYATEDDKVAEKSRIPVRFMQIDEVKINQFVRATSNDQYNPDPRPCTEVPGIILYDEKSSMNR